MPTLNKHLFLLMRFIFANTIIVDFGRLRCPLADAALVSLLPERAFVLTFVFAPSQMLLYLVSLFHLIFKSACVCLGVTRNLLEQPFDFHWCFFFTFSPVGQPGANTGILAVEQLQHSVAVALSVSGKFIT